MNRRNFLKNLALTGAAAAGGATLLSSRRADALAPTDVLWVQLQANGGWDQLLSCDPKPGLRSSVPANHAIRTVGGFRYVEPATTRGARIGEFFRAHHTRLLAFNGVDTGTNNHEVGTRYSASGSTNTGYPVFAAQVAAALGQGRPMAMVDVGGYDEAGDLLAPTRLSYETLGPLRKLREPHRFTGDWISLPNGGVNYDAADLLPGALRDLVRGARDARLQRLRAERKLPAQRRALDQLADVRAGADALAQLDLPPGLQSDTLSLIELGMRAWKSGLVASVLAESGGFDTHGGGGGDEAQSEAIARVLQLASDVVAKADALQVPVVVVVTSDFGRTPYADTGGGTDHWPVSTVLVLHNALSLEKTGLPVDRVIGVTTDGDRTTALTSVKLDPDSLQPSDTGVVVTPGHVMRVLRRVARIDGHPALARFPLSIGSRDLALG